MATIERFYARMATRLRERRLDLGFSQEEMADAIKQTRASYCNLEGGRQRVLPHHLAILAQKLRTTPNKLMGFKCR